MPSWTVVIDGDHGWQKLMLVTNQLQVDSEQDRLTFCLAGSDDNRVVDGKSANLWLLCCHEALHAAASKDP